VLNPSHDLGPSASVLNGTKVLATGKPVTFLATASERFHSDSVAHSLSSRIGRKICGTKSGDEWRRQITSKMCCKTLRIWL
jgi:hypothetical protein